MSAPDRTLPRLNDSWAAPVPGQMARAFVLFPGRADFAWMATGGAKGAPPPKTSHAFPYAGYFVMRSDWQAEANYLVFDAGPLGYGHVHQDKLNVALWGWGRELLLDNGGGNYEQSKWRTWVIDTFSHNTALVDGRPQRRQTKDRAANVSRVPVAARWISTPAHDFARGVYDEGYGALDDRPVVHTKSEADAESHRYEVRWHLPTTATQQDRATGIVRTVDAGRPNLAVVPLKMNGLEVRSASAQAEPELLGWDVRKGKVPQVVPATTVVHARAGAGAQQLITLLLPLKVSADSPIRSVEATTTGGAVAHLIDGRIFHVEPDRFSETLAGNKPGRQATFAP